MVSISSKHDYRDFRGRVRHHIAETTTSLAYTMARPMSGPVGKFQSGEARPTRADSAQGLHAGDVDLEAFIEINGTACQGA